MNFYVYRNFAALQRALPKKCLPEVRFALLTSVRAGTMSDIEAAGMAQKVARAIETTRHLP